MRFLIAGFGSIGRRHLRNLLALGEQDIVLYRSRKSTLPDDEIAAFPVETDLAAALAHRPDAVILSNPTALHLDVAIPAAEAGCHLFFEKPIAHSLDRLDELKAAVQRGGGQVLVGFQFRFHPGLRQIYAWIQDGRIGRPLAARAHWGEYLPDWHPWEDYRASYAARTDLGGGVVLTLCHPLDYLRWLLGDVTQLAAMTGQISDLELAVEDTAEISLRFANRAIGSLHLNYHQRPPSHHLEILGTAGTIRWDNADGIPHLYQTAGASWQTAELLAGFERNVMFLDELRHFRAVIAGEEQPVCTLTDGIAALRLALSVHQSQQSGQTVQL